jgi:hypothetical protein
LPNLKFYALEVELKSKVWELLIYSENICDTCIYDAQNKQTTNRFPLTLYRKCFEAYSS